MQKDIFNIQSQEDFKKVTLEVFKHQFKNNKVYRSFCDLLYVHPSSISQIEEIPFLPIQFFKSRKVITISNNTFNELKNLVKIRNKKDIHVIGVSISSGFKKKFPVV